MNKYRERNVSIFYTKIKEQITQQSPLRIDKKCEQLPSIDNQNEKEQTEKASTPPKKKAAHKTKEGSSSRSSRQPTTTKNCLSARIKRKYPAPQPAANRKKAPALPPTTQQKTSTASTQQPT